MSAQASKARPITRTALKCVGFRPPFAGRDDAPASRARVRRCLFWVLLGFPLTYLGVLVGYYSFGGPDRRYWNLPKVRLTNPAFAIMYLNSCKSASSFLAGLLSAVAGLGVGLASLPITSDVVFELTFSYAAEFVVGSLIMRMFVDTRFKIETVKSLRFLVVVVVMATVASLVGASIALALLSRGDHVDGQNLEHIWVDWFVGNISSLFISAYLGYVIVAYSFRKEAVGDLRKVLGTRLGLLSTAVVLGCAAIIITVYSLEGMEPWKAVPLMLMVMPVLGSLSLSLPQFATVLVDVVLVIAGIYGTADFRGPLAALLSGASPREGGICVQVSILMSVVLTSIFRVARHQRMAAFELLRKDTEKQLAFFTHVSHEFRTPLSVVIGYTEDLLEHHQLRQAVRSDLENILYASLGMSGMVEDLLALFRLEKHGLVYNSRPAQTQKFFDKVLSVTEVLARPKRHHVSMQVDLPPTLVFDPSRMNQVVVNLLSNAVKFTPEGGLIKIDARLVNHSEPRSSSGGDVNDNVDGNGPADDTPTRGEHPATHESTSTSTINNLGSSAKRRFSKAVPAFAGSRLGRGSGTSSNSDGSGSKRWSFTTVHSSRRFNEDSNLNSSLVVELDGSNGLLADPDRRRRTSSSQGMTSGGRGGNLTNGVGESPPMASRPLSLPPPDPGRGVPYTATATSDDERGSKGPLMVISVTDSGPGIPPADVRRLFERFFRADKTGVEGTGLGLTICQHIATSLGGQIEVSSIVGVGSTFTVTVPVDVVPAPDAAPTTVTGQRNSPTAHRLPSPLLEDADIETARPASGWAAGQSDATSPAPMEKGTESTVDDGGGGTRRERKEAEEGTHGNGRPGTAATAVTLTTAVATGMVAAAQGIECGLTVKVRVLLAEDSMPNQKLMCRILERAGHSVETVGDGQAAVDRIVSGDFDLLVLDLGLPKKMGLEVLAELRAMPAEAGVGVGGAVRNIPVIISSGHVLDETRRLCVESGCNAFTEKPFRAKVIVETVQRVMREHLAGINVAGGSCAGSLPS
eukprot:g9011.t1